MELDSLPEVIKIQPKPRQNGAQGGHTVVPAPAPGAFCPEQGSERTNSLFLWNLCFLSFFYALILGFFFFFNFLSCHGDPAELSSLFLEMELLFHPPAPSTSRHRELWDLPRR